MNDQKKIGEKIKKYRIMTGFTQAELASELTAQSDKTVAPTAITAYENGQRVPKVKMRVQIANILGVDPVELADLQLSEMDEKRLLCKLLYKYALRIEEAEGENDKVSVLLDDDFYGFLLEHKDLQERLSFLNEDVEEGSDVHNINKQNAEEEMSFWLETYPRYDPVVAVKRSGQKCNKKSISKTFEMLKGKFTARFFQFQDNYIKPQRYKELKKKE